MGDPAGTNLSDGYQTLIEFAVATTASFWEKSVTPSGYDGGDTVDNTTMRNATYRTFRPRGLISMTEMTITVAYDPVVYDANLEALINVETTITVTFSDASTLTFFGYLRSFTPNEIVEGTQPEATLVIQPTNWDTTGDGAEAGPTYAAG